MAWAPLYATEDELRAYVRDVPSEDEADEGVANNALIYTPALTAASREIDRSCGRQFGSSDSGEDPQAVEFSYTPKWMAERGAFVASIDDLFDDGPELSSSGTEIIFGDYTLLPLNAAEQGKPWTYVVLSVGGSSDEGSLSITAHWGWTAVPDTIKNATLLQASRLVKRRDAPFGVAGSPDMGNELRLLAKLDPDVEVMVGAYRRYW